MTTLTVIPNFNVFEDSVASLSARGPAMTLKQFPTKRGEETFGHGIVITVGSPTHAGNKLMRGQQLAVIGGRILRPAIAVVQESRRRLPAMQGHSQSCQTQLRIHRFL